jgi:phosphoribosylamine--glycine ligase
MGTFAPVPWLEPDELGRLGEQVVAPTLAALRARGTPFRGLLYPGLKLSSTGPKVLEFNARFGDPETQSSMRLLDSDLFELLDACLDGRLARTAARWRAGYAACVVVASGGYPGPYRDGLPISGLDAAQAVDDVVVFHAGTASVDGRYVTAGGRVLGVTATGSTLERALAKAYDAVERVHFDGKHFRSDIGRRPGPSHVPGARRVPGSSSPTAAGRTSACPSTSSPARR